MYIFRPEKSYARIRLDTSAIGPGSVRDVSRTESGLLGFWIPRDALKCPEALQSSRGHVSELFPARSPSRNFFNCSLLIIHHANPR